MSDGPEWFAPKRYGYGAAPSSWQGWALLAGYIVLISIAGILIPQITWIGYASIMVMLTVTLMVIVARTTKGGLRWRREGDE